MDSKLLKILREIDIDEFVDEILKSREEEYENAKNFVNSRKFHKLLEIIKGEEYISEEALLYGSQKINNLRYNDFMKVCNTVFEVYKDKIYQVKTNSFPVFNLEYEGINFTLIIGQGALYSTQRIRT